MIYELKLYAFAIVILQKCWNIKTFLTKNFLNQEHQEYKYFLQSLLLNGGDKVYIHGDTLRLAFMHCIKVHSVSGTRVWLIFCGDIKNIALLCFTQTVQQFLSNLGVFIIFSKHNWKDLYCLNSPHFERIARGYIFAFKTHPIQDRDF